MEKPFNQLPTSDISGVMELLRKFGGGAAGGAAAGAGSGITALAEKARADAANYQKHYQKTLQALPAEQRVAAQKSLAPSTADNTDSYNRMREALEMMLGGNEGDPGKVMNDSVQRALNRYGDGGPQSKDDLTRVLQEELRRLPPNEDRRPGELGGLQRRFLNSRKYRRSDEGRLDAARRGLSRMDALEDPKTGRFKRRLLEQRGSWGRPQSREELNQQLLRYGLGEQGSKNLENLNWEDLMLMSGQGGQQDGIWGW